MTEGNLGNVNGGHGSGDSSGLKGDIVVRGQHSMEFISSSP